MSGPVELRIRVIDVPLDGVRTLRIAIELETPRDPAGRARVGEQPVRLVLAAGTGRDRAWRENPREGVSLPWGAVNGVAMTLLGLVERYGAAPDAEPAAGGPAEGEGGAAT